MAKIVTIANCQSGGITSLIQLASSKVEITRIPPIHTINEKSVDQLIHAVEWSDIVIHQNFTNTFGPISSEEIKNRYPDKTYISVPSIYFGGIFPHLSYLRLPGGGTFKGPTGDYHDLRVLDGYLKGWSEAMVVAALDEPREGLAAWNDACVLESVRRDTTVDIPIMEVILDRITNDQTMFTFNHCDNHVLWHIATRILTMLGLPLDAMKSPPKRKFLGNVIAGVPDYIPESLNYSWRNPDYFLDGKRICGNTLVTMAYDTYRKCDNLDTIVLFNRDRFGISV